MAKWLVLLLFFMVNCSWGTLESSYEEGTNYANSLQDQTKAALSTINKSEIPGFTTDNPPEAALYDNAKLIDDQARQSLQTSDVGQTITETAKTRQRFTIDPHTDPLFTAAQEHSMEEILNIKDEQEVRQAEGVIEKTCEEGGEDITYECFENRHVVPQVPIKTATLNINHLAFSPKNESYVVQTRSGGWNHHGEWETRHRQNGWSLTLPKEINAFKNQFCQGFVARDIKTGATFNIDCARIQNFKINDGAVSEANGMVNVVVPSFVLVGGHSFWSGQRQQSLAASINITLYHDTFEGEEIDEWRSNCDSFEQMVEQDLCQYGERVLTQGAETRNINGYLITKDAWQYRQLYHCKMIKDECSILRTQGCYQVGSRCKEQRQNKCWIYEQKYQCSNGKLSLSKTKTPELGAFCLTGNCHDTSYQANGEMLDVVSRLSVLQAVQDDIRLQNNSDGNFKIFSGTPYTCSRNCVNFKDCCGGMNGWGVKLHLAGCKPEEKQLADMRQKNLCHQVGTTYCAKKVMGKCLKKKTSFCCFGTKFAKLLQEQGRPQLGLDWGTKECPNCRALTIEELTKMDLSKMDFRELFDDVMKKYKQPDLNNLREVTKKQIAENMKRIADGLKPKAKSGVVGENQDSL